MVGVTLIAPAAGELIGDAPDRRVELLSDADPLHATWSRFGSGREGADPHVHHRHTDLFYVLDGELEVRLGVEEEPVAVPAGSLARVPPLVVHGFRNTSDADVTYLNLHAPGCEFAAFLRALRDGREFSYDQHPPPADGGRPTTLAAIGAEGVLTQRPGGHETLLADIDEISVSLAEYEPGAAAPPAGPHRDHLESIYVLDGELGLSAGGRELRATAGSWLQLPPKTPRALSVPGDEPVRFLDLHTPGRGFAASRPAGGASPA